MWNSSSLLRIRPISFHLRFIFLNFYEKGALDCSEFVLNFQEILREFYREDLFQINFDILLYAVTTLFSLPGLKIGKIRTHKVIKKNPLFQSLSALCLARV